MGLSLADLDAVAASEQPFKLRYIDPNGEDTGVTFLVRGDQSAAVQAEAERLLNAQRREDLEAAKENKQVFRPVRDDREFFNRMVAIRLVGWEGLDDEFTPDAALQLVRSSKHIADAILKASNDVANFTKARRSN